eukprot:TRINITY_DN11668_c0_g1_i2.p1 TRINITY_DN11668_c0_g1~~TRINITY_DN11668_c0_g1_i2.p1  ORF type:complete len:364 (+),score=42.96 TRINITY_DN11668_c0_g1_i2:69-1160(+)
MSEDVSFQPLVTHDGQAHPSQPSRSRKLVLLISLLVVLTIALTLTFTKPFSADSPSAPASPSLTSSLQFTFMTFNIENGGEAYNLSRAADLILQSGADIVTVQESYTSANINSAPRLANLLNWYYIGVDLSNDTSVLSRWPIEFLRMTDMFVSTRIRLPVCDSPALARPCPRKSIYVISAHYYDQPYQPFQAANISYNDSAPFISDPVLLAQAAYEARGVDVDRTIFEAIRVRQLDDAAAFILGGDFNEPSHLDWTPRAARNGLVPYACQFPSSVNFTKYGFGDAYRTVHVDEVADRGLTWPGHPVDYPSRPDRIDFIYYGQNTQAATSQGMKLSVVNASVIPQGVYSPSDHRATYAQFLLSW